VCCTTSGPSRGSRCTRSTSASSSAAPWTSSTSPAPPGPRALPRSPVLRQTQQGAGTVRCARARVPRPSPSYAPPLAGCSRTRSTTWRFLPRCCLETHLALPAGERRCRAPAPLSPRLCPSHRFPPCGCACGGAQLHGPPHRPTASWSSAATRTGSSPTSCGCSSRTASRRRRTRTSSTATSPTAGRTPSRFWCAPHNAARARGGAVC
jgi:hypothetical protein